MARVLAVVMTAMLVGGGEADTCPTGLKEWPLSSSELRMFEDQGLWYEVASEDLSKLSGCSCLRYDYRTPGLCSDPRYGNSREIPGTSRMPTAPYQILEIGAMGEYAVVYACIGLPYGQVVEKNVTFTYIFALNPHALEKNTIDFEGIKSRLTAQGIDATKIKIVPQPETCKYPEAKEHQQQEATTSTTTSTPTVVLSTFAGTVSFMAVNLDEQIVLAAATPAIATHFGLLVGAVSGVTATQQRRLVEAGLRKLSGTWSVDFILSVTQSEVASITSIAADANPTALTTALQTELTNLGVPASDVNSFIITAFTAVKVTTTTPGAGGGPTSTTTSAAGEGGGGPTSKATSTTRGYSEPPAVTAGSSLAGTAFLSVILISTTVMNFMMRTW